MKCIMLDKTISETSTDVIMTKGQPNDELTFLVLRVKPGNSFRQELTFRERKQSAPDRVRLR